MEPTIRLGTAVLLFVAGVVLLTIGFAQPNELVFMGGMVAGLAAVFVGVSEGLFDRAS